MKAARCTAIALLALAGCVTVEPPPDPEPEGAAVPAPQDPPVVVKRAPERPARAGEVDALISEFQRLRRLPPNEVAREQDAARQAFNQSRSEPARVRLAMALALPGSPVNEEGRALELLDPLVKNPGSALNGLALLIASYLQEQRRLSAQVQGLQQNVHGLQQKLDALKTLERSLTERGEAAPQRKR